MDSALKLFRAATLVMGLLFVFSAALQYNDPDPIRWAVYYSLAAVVSFAAMSKERWEPPAITGALAILWLCELAYVGLPDEPHPMAIGPQTGWLADEVVREGGGLMIVLTWMVVLVVRARTREPVS